jgi:HTH-type transcriptional regulator / antitoxin HipB
LGGQGAVWKRYNTFAGISIWVALSCLDQWIREEDREGSAERNRVVRETTPGVSQQEQESMSDLERYVKKRKRRDSEFAEGFEVGYSNFKVGVLLRQAREKAGMTQDDVARRLRTKKSAISRIENHAEDIRLSTIQKYAKALGKNLRVEILG